MSPKDPSDPEPLDFRRMVDLRLNAEGEWFHEAEPFENLKLIALFDRGLDLHPDTGEPILRVADKWCYLRCDDLPFVVRRFRTSLGLDRPGLLLIAELNTGEVVEVGETGLEIGANGVVYLEVDARRRARVCRAAQASLSEWLTDDDGLMALRLGGRRLVFRVLTEGGATA